MGVRNAAIDSLKALAAEGDNDRFLQQSIAGLTMSYREWPKLDNERQHMRLKFNAFFKDYDILLCPVLASAAYPRDSATLRIAEMISRGH